MKRAILVLVGVLVTFSSVDGSSLFVNPRESGLYKKYGKSLLPRKVDEFQKGIYFSPPPQSTLKELEERLEKTYRTTLATYDSYPENSQLEEYLRHLEQNRALVRELSTRHSSSQVLVRDFPWLLALISQKGKSPGSDLPSWVKKIREAQEKREGGEVYQSYRIWKELREKKICPRYSLFQIILSLIRLDKGLSSLHWKRELKGKFRLFRRKFSQTPLWPRVLWEMARWEFSRGKVLWAAKKCWELARHYEENSLVGKGYQFLWKKIYPLLSAKEKKALPPGLISLLSLRYRLYYQGFRHPYSAKELEKVAALPQPYSFFASLLVGQIHRSRGDIDKGTKMFQSILARARDSYFTPLALLEIAQSCRLYWQRTSNFELKWIYEYSGVSRLEEFLENFPYHYRATSALVNLWNWKRKKSHIHGLLKPLEAVSQTYLLSYQKRELIYFMREICHRHPQRVARHRSPLAARYYYEEKKYRSLFALYPHSHWAYQGVMEVLSKWEKDQHLFLPGQEFCLPSREKKLFEKVEALLKEWRGKEDQKMKFFSTFQLSRLYFIQRKVKLARKWWKRASQLKNSENEAYLLWLKGEELVQSNHWPEALAHFRALGRYGNRELALPALYRASLLAEKLGLYEICLNIALEKGNNRDLRYLLDVVMTPEDIASYVAKFPQSSQIKLLKFSLALRYLRQGEYSRSKKVFGELEKEKIPSSWKRYIKAKLRYTKELETLESIADGSERESQRLQALLAKGKILSKKDLLFYNRPLWKGGRAVAITYNYMSAPRERKCEIRGYMKRHNTLERALEVFWEVQTLNPSSLQARQALLESLKCCVRLSDYNAYYRGEKWIGEKARKIMSQLEKYHPQQKETKEARRLFRRHFGW